MKRVLLACLAAAALVAGCGEDEEAPARGAAEAPAPAEAGASSTPALTVTGDKLGVAKPEIERVPKAESTGVLRFKMERLNGRPDDLARYAGKVVLVVNTASYCGETPQYAKLEKLYRERRAKNFAILGFPANDFQQEPDANAEIAKFCKENFGVSFPMFAKVQVTGSGAHPFYKELAAAAGGREPDWNFTKYLLAPGGKVVERFDAHTEPDEPGVVKAIDDLIAAEKT